ncbi:MAG TPA: glycosyltransferase, partial [Candidatus Nitrosotenuis sp.]|nr:glycosyltransferase [Candidatus Nitrosotenuis sp.]
MRVLLVSERFPPQKGGVAVAARRNALHAAAWLEHLDVVHLSSDLEPGEARGTNLAPNVMVHTLGRASREEESLQILEQSLRALLRGGSHDLVHAFFAGPTATAALLAARMAGRPTLVSVRGNDVDRGPYDRG